MNAFSILAYAYAADMHCIECTRKAAADGSLKPDPAHPYAHKGRDENGLRIAIRSLWPEAFAHGSATSAWVGVPISRDWQGIRYALRLRITDGAGAGNSRNRKFLRSYGRMRKPGACREARVHRRIALAHGAP